MTVAIICMVSFVVVALHNYYKANEKKKADRAAKHLEQMQEIKEAINQLEKNKRALANRKSAQENHWF